MVMDVVEVEVMEKLEVVMDVVDVVEVGRMLVEAGQRSSPPTFGIGGGDGCSGCSRGGENVSRGKASVALLLPMQLEVVILAVNRDIFRN